MTKGFALVVGDKVEVLVGKSLTNSMEIVQRLNRNNPLERAELKHCHFIYAGRGMVEHVKLGRTVG